jgi:hypothetical protein
MPDNIAIAAFVFGAILILIALLGGNFKLFGSEISTSISSRWLRFVAFALGSVFIVLALSPTPATPERTSAIPTPSMTTAPTTAATPTPIVAPSTPPEIEEPTAIASSGECVITVTHPFASYMANPSHSARDLGRVDTGDYEVLASQLASWAGQDEMWYQISYNGRLGWINDNPILIGEKTQGCP